MKSNETSVAPRFGIATLMSGFGPKPFLAPDNEGGNGGDDAAAKAAAEAAAKLAAEKAAADAAEKAAAEKAAADKAEADRLESEKNMTEAEKEKQKLLREVMEKKAKLKDAEEAIAAAKAEAEKFKGLDLDKIKALLEAEKERETKELEAKGEFDRLKQMIAAEREAEKKTWTEERQALESQVSKLLGDIDNLTIGSDFGNSAFIRDDLILTPAKTRVLYGSHFEVKDGKRIAYDKPAGSANRTPLVDASGEPLSFDAALRKIVEADPDKDAILKSKVTPGAGSKNANAGSRSSQEIEKKGDGLYGASRILAGLNAGK